MDPSIGRFTSTDPLQEKYPNISSYAYCYGNPIIYFDPNGMEGWTRFWGGLRALGGTAQMVAGVGLLITPEPTMVTKVGGVVAVAHGADDFQTGWRQLWSGEDQKSLTQQGAQAGLEAVGVDSETAELVADGTDMALSLVGGTGATYKVGGMLSRSESTSKLPSIIAKIITLQSKGFLFQHTLKEGKIIFNNSMTNSGRFDFIIQNGEVLLGEGHYYLSNGAKAVNGAGTITLKGGKISNISNWSGHYQPTMKELDKAIDF